MKENLDTAAKKCYNTRVISPRGKRKGDGKMYPQNLHTHGIYCDGKDDYEDTVKRAIELGLSSIGFSGHSYMFYSPSHSMCPPDTALYKKTVRALGEKYKDQIRVYLGLEFDMYSIEDTSGLDYMLGALHYLKLGDRYVGFDRDAATVRSIIDTEFGGDGMKYAARYYEELSHLPEYGKFDAVAHFDLVTKHRETHDFFDTESAAYRAAAVDCMRALVPHIPLFEVNTGAIARGYRTTPYPDLFLLKELKRLGGGVILGSDCHDNRYLTCHFNEAEELIKEAGFRSVFVFEEGSFREIGI